MHRLAAPLFVVAALSACAGSDGTAVDSTSTPTSTAAVSTTVATTTAAGSVTISVVVGENSRPDRIETVALGASVKIEFLNPDSHDEFHLHGYDLSTGMVDADETATMSFTADKAGTFEIESHETNEVVVVLEVE